LLEWVVGGEFIVERVLFLKRGPETWYTPSSQSDRSDGAEFTPVSFQLTSSVFVDRVLFLYGYTILAACLNSPLSGSLLIYFDDDQGRAGISSAQ
jgi:hypothetical protein